MSFEINALRSLRVYIEPAGSYAVDNSANPSAFIDVPVTEGFSVPDPEREMLDPSRSVVRIDERVKKVLGKRSGKLQFSTLLASHGVTMHGAETTTPGVSNWALARLLRTIMGGLSTTGTSATPTQVQVGSTTTSLVVTTGHGVRWSPNSVIATYTTAGFELREVLSVTGDTISPKEAFSAAPITSAQVFGGATFFPTEDPGESLQFLIQGRENSDFFLARGFQGSFQIEAKPGQLASVNFDLSGAAVTKLADFTSLHVPNVSLWNPVAVVASRLTSPLASSSPFAFTPVLASDVSFTLGFSYAPITVYGGVETIHRMRRQRPQEGVLARVEITLPYEDDFWISRRDAAANVALFLQIGNQPGTSWMISMPTCQVVSVKRSSSATEIAGQTVTLESRLDETAASSATNQQRYAAFRMHAV